MANKYQQLNSKKLLHGTIKRAIALREKRDQLNARIEPQRAQFVPLELSDKDALAVQDLARKDRPRVRRWVSAGPTLTRHDDGWDVEEINGGNYKGRWNRFPITDKAPVLTSYAHAFESRIIARVGLVFYKFRAPKGYIFGKDNLGVYVVRKKEKRLNFRLHLNTGHIKNSTPKIEIRRACIAHERIQRKAAKIARATEKQSRQNRLIAQKFGVWITAQDSYRSGNCRSGTKTWGARYKLFAHKRYPARVIKRLLKTHDSVVRVIATAEARTVAEIEAGFCMIDGKMPSKELIKYGKNWPAI